MTSVNELVMEALENRYEVTVVFLKDTSNYRKIEKDLESESVESVESIGTQMEELRKLEDKRCKHCS